MEYALSKFVSIPSISGDIAKREDCRQAAIWLRKCFTQLGAEATMVGIHLTLCTIPAISDVFFFSATNRGEYQSTCFSNLSRYQ